MKVTVLGLSDFGSVNVPEKNQPFPMNGQLLTGMASIPIREDRSTVKYVPLAIHSCLSSVPSDLAVPPKTTA